MREGRPAGATPRRFAQHRVTTKKGPARLVLQSRPILAPAPSLIVQGAAPVVTASPVIPGHRAGGSAGGCRPVQIFRGYQWVEASAGTVKGAFLLASIARFLYPIVCLACDRPWP